MPRKTNKFKLLASGAAMLVMATSRAACTLAAQPVRGVCTAGPDVVFPAEPTADFVLAVNTGADMPVCDKPRLDIELGAKGVSRSYVIHLEEGDAVSLGLSYPGPARKWLAFAALPEDRRIHEALMADWSSPSDELRVMTILLDYSTKPEKGPTEIRLRWNGRDGITATCWPAD